MFSLWFLLRVGVDRPTSSRDSLLSFARIAINNIVSFIAVSAIERGERGAKPVHDAALRYFLEVVRCGSNRRGLVRLNVAASAISRQISKLEQELGSPLFERRARAWCPSAAGDLLAQHARRTLLGEEQVLNEVRRLRGLERGLVRVGCTEGFATDFMPRAISSFRRTYPGIAFEMHVDAPREVTRMVRDGDADIGLSFRFDPDKSVHVEYASSTPLVAIHGAGPSAGEPTVRDLDRHFRLSIAWRPRTPRRGRSSIWPAGRGHRDRAGDVHQLHGGALVLRGGVGRHHHHRAHHGAGAQLALPVIAVPCAP